MKSSSALATDAAGQLDVLWHDGHSLGVDGCQVGVLEEAHQVGLSSLLEGQDSTALETQVSLEVLGDLTNQALEGQLPDQELSALLVLPAVGLRESTHMLWGQHPVMHVLMRKQCAPPATSSSHLISRRATVPGL